MVVFEWCRRIPSPVQWREGGGGRGQAQSQDTGKRVAELGAAVSSVVCGQPA